MNNKHSGILNLGETGIMFCQLNEFDVMNVQMSKPL